LGFLEEAGRRSSIPAAADFEECIEGFKQLGCRRIAMAAKWDDQLMGRVGQYLREAGLEPLGYASQAHTAPHVMAVRPHDGIDVAIALGRKALSDHPNDDELVHVAAGWVGM